MADTGERSMLVTKQSFRCCRHAIIGGDWMLHHLRKIGGANRVVATAGATAASNAAGTADNSPTAAGAA
jgi:hypothetical protein